MLIETAVLSDCANTPCSEPAALNRTSISILMLAYKPDLWTYILLIPPIIGNIFRKQNQQNAQSCSLDIYIIISH